MFHVYVTCEGDFDLFKLFCLFPCLTSWSQNCKSNHPTRNDWLWQLLRSGGCCLSSNDVIISNLSTSSFRIFSVFSVFLKFSKALGGFRFGFGLGTTMGQSSKASSSSSPVPSSSSLLLLLLILILILLLKTSILRLAV